MSVFQSQYTRALKVNPSDDANIPYPNLIVSGLTTGGATNQLIDSQADFVTANIVAGDIVYLTTFVAATVVKVINSTTLLLNADITPGNGYYYSIYNSSAQTSYGSQGCYLYIGANDSSVVVTTLGGDVVEFKAIAGGTILPVQVVKVHSQDSGTSTNQIIALW